MAEIIEVEVNRHTGIQEVEELEAEATTTTDRHMSREMIQEEAEEVTAIEVGIEIAVGDMAEIAVEDTEEVVEAVMEGIVAVTEVVAVTKILILILYSI